MTVPPEPLPPPRYPGTGYQGGPATAVPRHDYSSPPPGVGARAGFGARLGAFLIDGALSALPLVAGTTALVLGPTRISTCDIDAAGEITIVEGEAVGRALCEVPSGTAWAMFAIGVAATIALWSLLAVHEGRTGAALGKRLFAIRTVDARTGEPLGAGRGVGRALIRSLLSTPPLGVGHLWMFRDASRQTWHDKMVGSVVVPREG